MIEKVTFTNNAENQINKITGDTKTKAFLEYRLKVVAVLVSNTTFQ